MRPDWDATWLGVADVLKLRSRCCRAQVGAVIVSVDNRVISATYNGPPPGDEVEGDCSNWCPRMQNNERSSDYDSCRSNHAERNGTTRANWTEMQGATIYITGSACITCARDVASSGIKRVVHRVNEGQGYRNPEAVETYLRSVGIDVERSAT